MLSPITNEEIPVLRRLAERIRERAADPKNASHAENWTRLNDLDTTVKPMVLVHLWETAWEEILQPERNFQCRSAGARFYENQLKRILWMAENIEDDGVVEPIVKFPTGLELHPYQGLNWEVEYADGDIGRKGAGHYKPVLIKKDDIEKLGNPRIHLDRKQYENAKVQAEAIFGDILDVIPQTTYFAGKVVDEYSWLRGLDAIYFDLVDDPDWVHAVLDRICENYLKRFREIEALGLWGRWDKSDPLGSTGLRFCSAMDNYRATRDKGRLELNQTWGFFTAEAFNNVSPAMHDEFAYTYDRRMASLFRFANIGCCEVLSDKIDHIRSIPNVRRISISEWADLEKAADAIGEDYVYGYKPSGVPFVMGWAEESVRSEIGAVLDAAQGCPLEIILNIGGTTGKNGAARLRDWTEIVNREIAARSG